MASSSLTPFSVPMNIDLVKERINEFLCRNADRKIALVTSGGTTVPLEKNTVRFVDNFSTGQRGSASTEYFLAEGYGVIFLHRRKSLLPYTRLLDMDNVLDLFQLNDDEELEVKEAEPLREILETKIEHEERLLMIPFETLADYLHYLKLCCLEIRPRKSDVLVYLSAAVSDFYIPEDELSEHKIQSRDGAITLTMQPVPKILRDLVEEWVPDAYVVTFKLETDAEILVRKSRQALAQYGHQIVIGNLLQTRRREVKFISIDDVHVIALPEEETEFRLEIEFKIVNKLVCLHLHYMVGRKNHE